MDIRFLSTFLEVAQTRHFGKAADNLYLTQSAVSARIKLLEEYFDTALFIRNRNSIQLSAAGEKLLPYAKAMAKTLSEARTALRDIGVAQCHLGATTNAFSVFLTQHLSKLEHSVPDLSVKTDLANIEQLSRQLSERTLDIAFSTEPMKSDDIHCEKIMSVPIKLFSNAKKAQLTDAQYVHIDWNPKISEVIFDHYPEYRNARLKTANYEVAKSLITGTNEILALPINQQANLWRPQPTPFELQLDLYVSTNRSANLETIEPVIAFIKTRLTSDK
ncbi:LysR family transcriptional regulator [Glaciecola sp. 1036]|uniref:LysR family transcriptional regulator n=1 Tax=Alteromonadaceae TaxID=72275 RepID=UPI003D0599D8